LLILLSLFFVWMKFSKDKIQYEQNIHPPIKSQDIAFEEYRFHKDSIVKIERTTGTLISISPNTFVHKNGTEVKDSVLLKVREFHNTEDIFKSGIPMSVDKNRKQFLQSAGMIELRAFSGGEEVEIKKEKTIGIELASFKKGDNYQLYHFDENNNWNINGTFTTGANTRKINRLKELGITDTTTKSDIIFDLVTNTAEAPYLRAFKDLRWKVLAEDIDDGIEEAMRIHWEEVKVGKLNQKTGKHTLSFYTVQNFEDDGPVELSFDILAIPVHAGNLQAINDKQWNKREGEYEKILLKIEDEKKRLALQADLMNTFRINRMGIWNIDKIMKMENVEWKEVEINFKENVDKDINRLSLFVLYVENNSLIEYLPGDWQKIGFKKGMKMKLKLVMPGGNLKEIGSDEIEEQLKTGLKKLTFQM
jgi:hypothetical protein